MTYGKKRKFNISCMGDTGFDIREVDGQLLNYTQWGFYYFIHRPQKNLWAISEYSTGRRICVGDTKEDAVKRFHDKMVPNREEWFKKEISGAIKKYGQKNESTKVSTQ